MRQREAKRQTKNLDLRTLVLIRRTHGVPALIARVAQVSPGFVSDVLNGRKRPSARFLAAVPRALDLARQQSQADAAALAGASFTVSSKG
jgi:transcriptional regulator with XRE-family HTH domain